MRFRVLVLIAALSTPIWGQGGARPHEPPAGANAAAGQAASLEDACISDLRLLGTAQGTYSGLHPDRGFARKLSQLGPKGENLVGPELPTGKKDGYRFTLTVKNAKSPVSHYEIHATPLVRLIPTQDSYYVDETGVIRWTAEDRRAGPTDPQIKQ